VSEPVDEVVDLLRQLIRNACVNDGTPSSGQEQRNVEALEAVLAGPGLDLERLEALPGRPSLIARMEGRDPGAPSLLLMGHTDVVPATPERWRRDPFGAELVEGEVWGRGAVDMLNLTASMAVAVRRAARAGFRPRGTLVYLAVPDEEAAGTYGARWLTERAPDTVRADYVITEMGGFRLPDSAALAGPARGTAAGPPPEPRGPGPVRGAGPVRLPVTVAEKGTYWVRIRIRGTPGHASMPFRTDNALLTAAAVVQRLAAVQPEPVVHDTWRRFVEAMGFPPEVRDALLDPARVEEVITALPDLGLARVLHACTHTTIAPTVLRAGVKSNVIPDAAELDVDVRTLPGQPLEEVEAMLRDALGDLADEVEIEPTAAMAASASPTATPLWDTLARISRRLVPGAEPVPFMTVGATDARFFRRLGAVCYGYGLFSPRISFGEFARMFHGDDERVDVDSLALTTELWEALIRDFLG
jgi:acetylornithine deacetylase/succinyl-diaminopimelate desuccinylase-like protein